MNGMESRRIFEILGINETKDEELIKTAYRRKLASVNPEDNPEGFKRLREAYEKALVMAGQQEDTEGKAEKESDEPADVFMREVEDVYRSLSRRLDVKEWERLLKNEWLDDLELGEEIKWQLFRYLSEYFRIPAPVWRLLDRVFRIVENAEEFKEYLPENFVDFMVWKSSEGAEATDFPFEKLKGEDTADYDAFIQNYNELCSLFSEAYEDKEGWLKKVGQKIAFMDGFGITHPWYEMEKAEYELVCGRKEEAERMVRDLWEAGEKDDRMLLAGANILKECGQEEEAAEIYRDFLGKENLSDDDRYRASIALAEICAGKKEWMEGREHAQNARRYYNTRKAAELLGTCNEEVIALWSGEKAAELTVQEAISLAWAYIQERRAEEGLEFFKEYPMLTEDTVKCHQVRTVLFMSCGMGEETRAEAELWRSCIEEEEEEDSAYWKAQSYEMEGKALQTCYAKTEDKDGEEAQRLKGEALQAFDKALELQPEGIDFLLAKLVFLREVKDYEPMLEICGKIKAVDKQYYWAYYYAQEAYEGLGKAQEVVDSFYEAKEIYAEMPEIYERAARVFFEYRQYSEVENILKQAEAAGVNSFYLRVRRLELMERAAESEEELKEADAYAGQLIEEMEASEEADAKTLSEAYLQRAYLHDESNAQGFRLVDEMEVWAKRSVELSDNLRNRYFLGRFYVEYREDAKPAYEHLKICEERGMDFEWMYYYIARSLEDYERWEEAIEYYTRAHEKNPDEFDFMWRIAWLYRWKYSFCAAPEYYETAMGYLKLHVEKFGENPRELWQLSDFHARHREYGLALEEIERVLKDSPISRNWGHKAFLLEMLDKREEAVIYYCKGIETSRKNGEDYNYAYSQMHDYFCETRQYRRGLEWFLNMMGQVQTEERRRKNLAYISYYHEVLKEWDRALETLEKIYGRTSLTDYVYDDWKEEGDRIDDLLDLYQKYLSREELRQKAEEAAALLEGDGAADLKEDHEGKRCAYSQIAYCYFSYLMDREKALYFFKKALEEAGKMEKGINSGDYRRLLRELMRCCWRLGDLKQAKEYQEQHRQSLKLLYKGCADLGRDAEELLAGDCSCARANLYCLFVTHYFCGEYEEAAKYLERMENSEWCWNCTRKDCTEVWECKGYMALYEGQEEEAVRYFERAIECSSRGNDDAERELRLLGR